MSAGPVSLVWEHSPYKGDRLVIQLAIAEVVNDMDGFEFRMTQAALAKKARTTDRTVRAALDAMVADGWLEVLEAPTDGRRVTGESPYLYRFTVPEEHHTVVRAEAEL